MLEILYIMIVLVGAIDICICETCTLKTGELYCILIEFQEKAGVLRP